ncbi:MAG: aldehyde dehydrogenase family protein [Propionibacteriaceae bacterium]|jgi:succinate-semialdehyde dehydrogenase/glutarate-semialdehyde dehydrogenase|nr:aldehyde dehydrogenase family protein [Propionibacteriaceae bacterium]
MSGWESLTALAAVPAERPAFDVISPIDGSLLANVPAGSPDDVREAVARARAAQPGWAALGAWERADVIARFAAQVYANQDDLLDLIHAENGKSRIHALDEVLDVLLTASYFSANAGRLLKAGRRRGAIPVLTSTRVHYQPKGVVGMITPWNYPLTLTASDAIAALLAGNAVVMKPDSMTPLVGLYVAKLLAAAGLPEGVFQVVPGAGRELGDPLITAVDHLMFTGSSATGRKVAAACAAQLKSCSAELGGKNPMIVLPDADIDRAVEGAMSACFSTSGQLCISIERMYIHESIYERFVLALAERTRALRLGGGPGWDVDLGPLISAEHLEKVRSHVADAVAKGAKVLAGGQVRADLGPLFFEPTILEGVDDSMAVAREETFGPVVSVYRYSDVAAAVRAANDTEYGLNASVWGRDIRLAKQVAKQLHAGSVNINEGFTASFGSLDAPMGGMGISGLGRRHGPEGIRNFTEPQTISRQRLLNIAPPPGVSREMYAKAMSAMSRFLYVTPRAALSAVRDAVSAPKPSFSSSSAPQPSFRIRSAAAQSPARSPFGALPFGTKRGVPLSGARVLVTGGGSGMGRLMALGAAARGAAAVTIWDLSAERAAAVAAEITARGGRAASFAVDVSSQESVAQAAAATGDIDVLINSAGVVGGRTLLDEPNAAIERTIDVNLKSLFWVTKSFLQGMIDRHHGYVVVISSASGVLGGAKMTDYSASKFGAMGFTESLRNELRMAETGVGALAVAPFYTKTGMFDGVKTRVPLLLPLLDPQQVADKVLDGIETGRRLIIMPWFVYTIYLLRLLPIPWLDAIADFFGINASMGDFKGRETDRV